MTHRRKTSGIWLALAGLLGIAFFWLTDPKYGFAGQVGRVSIDQINEAWPGTLIGAAGSALVLLIGLWLMTRKAV
jgi:hypothetical protein